MHGYPKMTAFQSMMLLSCGAPHGSCERNQLHRFGNEVIRSNAKGLYGGLHASEASDNDYRKVRSLLRQPCANVEAIVITRQI